MGLGLAMFHLVPFATNLDHSHDLVAKSQTKEKLQSFWHLLSITLFPQCLGHMEQLRMLPSMPVPLMIICMCILGELQSSVSYSFTLNTSKDCFVRATQRTSSLMSFSSK